MATNQPREHIIAYDIADPKRLAKLHRMLKKIALPLQYSVFYMRMSDKQRDKLADSLENKIDPQSDDVRIYALPKHFTACCLGRKAIMDGLQLSWEQGRWFNSVERYFNSQQE